MKKGDFSLTHPDEFFDPKYPEIKGACKLQDNGYFNIYLKKDSFPVTAPSCQSNWLKLTMKGSDAPNSLTRKRELWSKIQKVDSGELDQLQIIIELNPYVRIISADPLELELDYCNLWFRCAYGEYVPHTEAISMKK